VAKIGVTLTVNGEPHELLIEPDRALLDVLRTDLDLRGTKTSCLEGRCGACTVLLDGIPANSCLVLAAAACGRPVTTIEGLARDGVPHPVQQAFVDHGAVQCGYCTPGMILSATALLDERPAPTESEIREALAGNLCRCTGYQKIVEAVMAAARVMVGGGAA
jgi:aerobic carbon-monoxide dehydrogenase small subunit